MEKKSTKTTIAGIAQLIGVIAMAVAAFCDGDPDTVMDLPGVLAAIGALGFGGGALGLIKAKDH